MSSLYEALSPVQKDLPWLPHLNHHNLLLKGWMIGTTFSKAGTRKEKRSQSSASMTRKRILQWQSRCACAGVPDEIRHLRAELRFGKCSHVLRARWLHRGNHEAVSTRRSALHASLPLVLCVASARRLHTLDE